MTSLQLTEIADLAVWRAIQRNIFEATGLRFSLWDDEPMRVLQEDLPPSCQYVQEDKSRRERCEQFHRSVRAEARRTRKSTCATCPFGMQYMAIPLKGEGMLPGHWEGGYVVDPRRMGPPDPSLEPGNWYSALAGTPHRNAQEVAGAIALIETLYQQIVSSLALRERRRSQVAQLVGFDAARTLDDTHSLTRTLQRVVYLVTQVLAVPIGVLFLKERATGDLVVVASEGLPEEAVHRTRLRPGEGVAGRVLETGGVVLLNDLDRELRAQYDWAPFDKVRSLMGVPIELHGEVVGVLDLASLAPNSFQEDDVGLIQMLASLLQGILLQDPARRLPVKDNEQITVNLRAATASMGQMQSPGDMLEQVMDVIVRVTKASSGALLLLDRASGELRLRCSRGLGSEAAQTRLRLGEGVAGWVAETGEPLYLADVETDSRYINVREDLRSELAVPLMADGEVIGVVEVASIHHHFFSQEELQLLTVLASFAALALREELSRA